MYGVGEPVSFITKMQRLARERIFIMMRELPMAHPAALIRERLLGVDDPRMPRFSDLFMVLIHMGIAPDVNFIRYPIVQRYADIDEALADCRPFLGRDWDEAKARTILQERPGSGRRRARVRWRGQPRRDRALATDNLTIRPVRPSDRKRVVEMTRDIWDGHDYVPRVFDDWVSDAGAAFQAIEQLMPTRDRALGPPRRRIGPGATGRSHPRRR